MECEKVGMDLGKDESSLYPIFLHRKIIKKSRKTHKCSECGREIAPGESYEYVFGKWPEVDEIRSYKTCSDCIIARNVFFYGYDYVFGFVWEDIFEEYRYCMIEDCIAQLTPYHRDRLCEKIEKEWEEEEDDEKYRKLFKAEWEAERMAEMRKEAEEDERRAQQRREDYEEDQYRERQRQEQQEMELQEQLEREEDEEEERRERERQDEYDRQERDRDERWLGI